MQKEDLDLIIDKLVEEGIEVTIRRMDGRTIYDLNLRAKRNLWLYYESAESEIHYNGRYQTGTINSYEHVLYVATRFYREGGLASPEWINLLVKNGLLKQKIETKVTYE